MNAPVCVDLDIDDSANNDVSLTCNTTHLLGDGHFDGGLRGYYLGIDCFHDNGSQVSNLKIPLTIYIMVFFL